MKWHNQGNKGYELSHFEQNAWLTSIASLNSNGKITDLGVNDFTVHRAMLACIDSETAHKHLQVMG